MRHLTRIVGVPFGVNILGLLEIFAFVGTIFGATAASDHVPRFLGLAALVGAPGLIVAFDLWWRHRQPEATKLARLFSPFAGGCFAFVPIWLLFPIGALTGVIAVLVKSS